MNELLRGAGLSGLAFFISVNAVHSAAERIQSIQVKGNEETVSETIIALSELQENQQITDQILLDAKNLVASSGNFETVEIQKLPGKDADHVIISIVVKEKTTWFIVPMFQYSEDSLSAGGVVGENNLFGRMKKGGLFSDYGPLLKRVAFGYRDPHFFDTKLTLSIDGIIRSDKMIEYRDRKEARRVSVVEYGGTFLPGYRWSEKFTTSFGGYYRRVTQKIRFEIDDNVRPIGLEEGNDVAFITDFEFKNTTNYDGLLDGNEVKLTTQFSDNRFLSDFNYVKQLIYFLQAFTFLENRANSVTRASVQVGKTLPYYLELMMGGQNLRGYINRQFRGDTRYSGSQEFMFPLFSLERAIVRTNVFWDSGFIYFKDGPRSRQNWHNGVGLGVRVYLKGIAIPLVGYDFGWGIEDKKYASYVSVGANF